MLANGAVNHTDPGSPPPANTKQLHWWIPAAAPRYTHMTVRDEAAVPGSGKEDERTIRNEPGREFACSENIDIQIGRVLRKLEEMGELENTYVFYTADHGMAIGRHGLQGKQNLYEHTWRSHSSSRARALAGSRAPVHYLDVLATLVTSGIEAPKTSEGKSFKPVLLWEKQFPRATLRGLLWWGLSACGA